MCAYFTQDARQNESLFKKQKNIWRLYLTAWSSMVAYSKYNLFILSDTSALYWTRHVLKTRSTKSLKKPQNNKIDLKSSLYMYNKIFTTAAKVSAEENIASSISIVKFIKFNAL